MEKKNTKRPPGAIQGRSCRVSKRDLKMEGTWDRFFIDFGTVWGGPGPLKILFSYHSGTDFTIFGFLNITCNLRHQKPQFWVRFGGHVGVQKSRHQLQEASWARRTRFFGGSKRAPTTSIKIRAFWVPQECGGQTSLTETVDRAGSPIPRARSS